MTGAPEQSLTRSSSPDDADTTVAAAAAPYRIVVVDADSALLGLIQEWLGSHGCIVSAGSSDAGPQPGAFDAVIVDLPFPRNHGLQVLARVRRLYPHTPVLALSAGFFAGVDSAGAVARSLGVSRALPKPVTREALVLATVTMLHADPTGVTR